ncbi:SpoIIE family protein phosphatase [Kitasatospora sp. NPDC005856]|uniref:SpoIIE family protein phosphatase n=1 Tax=Kitasatospora sp. NPDC005856 TaxID=3154566 RepID=UPI00340D7230
MTVGGASSQSPHVDPRPQGDAFAVVDPAGRVSHWSPGAERLLGHRAEDVLGTAATDLLGDRADTVRLAGRRPGYLGSAPLRRRDGGTVEAALWATALGGSWLLQADQAGAVRQTQLDHALLDALFAESPVVVGVFDIDRRFLALNRAGRLVGGITGIEGRTLREVAPPELLDLDAFEERQRTVLETGQPLVRVRVEGITPAPGRRRVVWSETVLPLRGGAGEPIGLAHILVDDTRQQQARERLRLVNEAGLRIGGGPLDARDTAQRLAEFVVPRLCDHAHVELFEFALGTGEPDPDAVSSALPLLRAATAGAATRAGRTGPADPGAGEVDRFASTPGGPVLRALASRRPLLMTGAELSSAATDSGDTRAAAQARERVHSWLAVPMYAGEQPLGVAVLVRSKDVPEHPHTTPLTTRHTAPRRFERDDVVTAAEIVRRAATAIDHARRYARERARARDLQRLLLPSRLSNAPTIDVAYRHLPARGPSGLGGAWYDYIRLSGARTALVVGDAAGNGLPAALYAPRIRTATRVLADQDLTPEEVLSGLDALVTRFMVDFAHAGYGPVGSTCLFAAFDPITQELTLASAGHPLPLIRVADRSVRAVDMPIGRPLGVHGTPYESTVVPWTDGDVLVLGSKGLGTADGDGRQGALVDALSSLTSPSAPSAPNPPNATQTDPSALCDHVINRLSPSGRLCDAVLMAARLRSLQPERYADWDLADDPAEVGRARTLVAEQLTAWGLEDLEFGTQLMVSELVTNALRYGKPPIRLRLIRDQGLTCEVTDHSSTSPHVRHAADTDEGGRGLYMVAQLADLWGTRYHDRGKTIWVRQPLPPEAQPPG